MNIKELFKEVLSFLFGNINGLFMTLIATVALDFITGICVAVHEKRLSSNIGYKGITKKVLIFILIAISNVIDTQLLGASGALYSVSIIFYLTNECISILENSASIGIPIPQKLQSTLEALKKHK